MNSEFERSLDLICVQRVNTLLQNITYMRDMTDADKVDRKRQRAAFAPNYIHSLDSSHMLMSAQMCYEQGLPFASVHDSYWTIPARVRGGVEIRDARKARGSRAFGSFCRFRL